MALRHEKDHGYGICFVKELQIHEELEYGIVKICFAAVFGIFQVALVTKRFVNQFDSLINIGDHELLIFSCHSLWMLETSDEVVEAGEQLFLILVSFY